MKGKYVKTNGKKRVIAYLHTHWDREWYRTKEEFNLRLLEVFDEILEELESGSMPCFYFDGQTAALEDYLKFRPKRLNTVKKFIKAGKLHIGPFFVSADNFLVNGISLVRNLNLGLEYSKTLGEKEFLGYLPDTFGHSRSIFDILKSFNILYSLVWRGVGTLKSNDFKMNNMNTTKLVSGYFVDILHTMSGLEANSKEFKTGVETLTNILDKIAQNSHGDLLLPIGADHLAALKNSSNLINQINKNLQNYYIELSSPFEYIKNTDYSKLLIEGELLDNSETYILPGVYSSRIPQKVENAKFQWDLFRITEPFCYFISNKNWPKFKPSLEYTVKELIKNHAHDSIYGCSTDDVHNTVQSRFDKVKQVTEGVKHRLIRDFRRKYALKPDSTKQTVCINSKPPKSQRSKICLINFSNYEYEGPVKITTDFPLSNAQLVRKYRGFSDEILYDTRQIPVTEQYLPLYEYLIEAKSLPPFSYSILDTVKPVCSLEINDNKISNPFIELGLTRVKENLQIKILDKVSKKEYSNALKVLVSKDLGDSYNSACPDKPLEWRLLDSKVIEKGPIRACLRLLFENNFKLDVYLTNQSKFFEFEAKFNNSKKNQKIQMCINLKNPIDTTFAEDAFGYIERKHDYTYNPRVHMPAKPKIEVKTNSFPMQRWVLAQDLGVITIGLNEYEIFNNELKITLSRGTARISEPKNLARFVPAGPPIETPDLQNLGFHNLKFAILLNADISSIQRSADTYYQPVVGFLGDFKNMRAKKFLNLPENLIFHGLKPAKNKVFGVFYNIGQEDILFKNKVISPKTIEFIEL